MSSKTPHMGCTSRLEKAMSVFVLLTLLIGMFSFSPNIAHAATGVPRIINNQGRLMNSSGTLLGGAGTDYCFKFSLYDATTVGAGTKVWPSASPSTMTVVVKNGVYNVGIGDTSLGGDTLNFNFEDNDSVYLNVEVATKVGATCAPGDGAEVFETLSPRQRLYASGYAINAATVGGYLASPSATGNQIPVLNGGHLYLGGTNPFINATSTNALTFQGGGAAGDILFFNSGNRVTASGNMFITGLFSASSTLFRNASTTLFSAGRAFFGETATTTIDAAGNVAVAGTLAVTGGTVLGNASTTNITATYASSTNLVAGAFTLSGISGILKATAGSVSNALVDLVSDVTNLLPAIRGGTGWANLASNTLLTGNGTGAVATTTVSTGLQLSGGLLTNAGVVSFAQSSGAAQTGAITFATSSTASNGVTQRVAITNTGTTFTVTPSTTGTLDNSGITNPNLTVSAGAGLSGGGSVALGNSTSIALDTSNANVWTGLQQFTNATTSMMESITQIARTIQSTSTNALVLRTNFSSTAGLTLGSTSTPQMLALNTVNNRVTIGTGGGTPVIFVLDTKNTPGDPTGIDGGEYYNSNTSEYRCYSGAAWRTCGGIAASSTGDVQFKNTDGSFTATSNFNWSSASNGLTIKSASSTQTTDLFTIASSTGTAMFGISSNGVLELATTTDPAASADQLKIYAKDYAGRLMPKWMGPSGVDTPFQSSVGFSNISVISPGSGSTVTTYVDTYGAPQFTASIGAGGTFTVVTPTSGSLLNQTRRFQLGSAAGTANTGAYIKHGSAALTNPQQIWRGNAAGLGGFFFVARFATGALSATAFNYIGLYDTPTTAPLSANPTTSTTYGKIGVGTASNTGNWQFIHNTSGAAPTLIDLGANFPINTTGFYEIVIFAVPNDSKVSYRAKNLTTGVEVTGTLTTNLPASTAFMGAVAWTTNGGTAAANNLQLSRIYLETDY